MKKSLFLATLREQALLFGIDPAKIRIEKQGELVQDLSEDEEIEVLRDELSQVGKQLKNLPGLGSSINYEATIVTESQLVKHLQQGWDLLQETNSGKYILRRPTTKQLAKCFDAFFLLSVQCIGEGLRIEVDQSCQPADRHSQC